MVRTRRDFTSDLSQLAGLRAFVREACQRVWGAAGGEDALARLELAVGEAAANVILHAYQGESGRPIEADVEAGADEARVTLRHDGRDFDPGAVPAPALDGSRESGYGLYLIQQAVDEVHYFRDEGGRCGVRLVKRRQ